MVTYAVKKLVRVKAKGLWKTVYLVDGLIDCEANRDPVTRLQSPSRGFLGVESPRRCARSIDLIRGVGLSAMAQVSLECVKCPNALDQDVFEDPKIDASTAAVGYRERRNAHAQCHFELVFRV